MVNSKASLQHMKERLFKKNQLIEIRISDMAFGGVGIGKIPTETGDFAVFVQNTIPGQLVQARVEKCDKRFAECAMVRVLEASAQEVQIPYQPIPGAPYITLPIEVQEEYKKRTALQLYKRIGKIEDIEQRLDQFMSSPSAFHYRNKMEYSFSVIRHDLATGEEHDDFALGFKHRGTWWCVENLDSDSGMFDQQLESNLYKIREWCEATGLPAWHPPKRVGFFRFLIARKSVHSDKLLINLVTSDQEIEKFDTNAFTQFMRNLLGERLAGLLHTINPEVGDRIDPLSGRTDLLYGDEKITEVLHGLSFEISMSSFFQTNPKSAERLYSKVLQYAGAHEVPEGEVIMDLFCGTGTITQLLAKQFQCRVIGVDIVESAIEDAKRNAQRNGVSGVEFYAADAGKFLLEYPEFTGKINTIVLDPPRAGIAPKTLRKVILLDAPRIVYVSCNPSTQARDAEALAQAGYTLRTISLADQFPHTSHIEAVALFEKA
jgi:23S rRNA (uracil-5-)-methyltransferase RumA